MNFVLALIVFFVSGVLFGYPNTDSTKVAEVSGSAQMVGIENGDTILEIAGTKLESWNDLTVVLDGVAKGENITADGKVLVKYFDESENAEKTAYVNPLVYVLSVDMVIENHALRVATGVLNEIMSEAVAMQQPPTDKGKRLKLYYITQVAVKPPTFVIFVNDKELMHFSYTRYIENRIRDAFGFKGTPLKFIIRERKEK